MLSQGNVYTHTVQVIVLTQKYKSHGQNLKQNKKYERKMYTHTCKVHIWKGNVRSEDIHGMNSRVFGADSERKR